MLYLVSLALALAIALGFGGWSARYALDRSEDVGTESVGPWEANPTAGSVDADPYSKARLARDGNLTLGIGEGIAFRATRDSAGASLLRQCSYRLEGPTPPARVWTLAPFTLEGRLVQARQGQPGWLVSTNLMRREDNGADIAVGPLAAPGNWLSVSGTGAYALSLTLYDTPASSSSGLGELEMPRIVATGCNHA
ncbi:DUF1214 domain-containing protein [Aurantimonas sp. MSK8Z-1]|uniref:DUF1214 domain-containing protein n=1 Tax=Mangrovibrevibacter kandeliae TaxID=2968473 RepID=UPI002119826B|nr:DUF1214 domain-containing protein [Aurantimonas sp. MSK8Z-1]MCW4113851.1 DUF1214 domain-containing protein [Aurantimonas sp. MSK8Z-1]